tara:strand:+ start:7187 stop:9355 length:2169 start_codon:yes stop_codon:yes gene_type:complete
MGLMTQKKLAEKGAEQIKEFLAKSKEDAIQKDFDEDDIKMADRQAEYESNLWKTDPSKQEAGLISPIDSVLEFTGVSSLGSAFDSVGSAFKGDYLGAGIEGLAAMVGAVPLVGSKLKKPLRDALGSSKVAVERGDIGVSEALMGGDFLKNYGEAVISRMDTLATKASVKNGKGKMFQPVEDGTRVGVRLNLNSVVPDAPKGLDKLQTIHRKSFDGEVLSYQPYATVTDVTFKVSPAKRRNIAAKIKGLKVKEVEHKNPAMSVNGLLAQTENVVIKGGKNVTEIGFNPMNNHLFIDMLTGQAVKSADVATVIGDRVYAKGVKYWEKKYAPKVMDASDGTPLPSEVRYKFNRGGLVEEMNALNFNEGGLPVKDENYGVAFIKKLMDEKRKKQERLARKTEAQAAKAAKEAKINSELSNQPTSAISVSPQDEALIKIEEPIETNIEKPQDNVLSDTFSDIVDEGKDVLRGIRDTVRGGYDSAKDVIRDIRIDYKEDKLEKEMDELRDYELESIYTPTIPTETEDETITNAVHKSIRREENGIRDGWDNDANPDRWMPHKSAEGGLPTIGYGHKFSSKEEMNEVIKKGGWTEQEALDYFKEDMLIAERKAKSNYEKEYKDREWSSLTTLDKLMLTEISFNIGDLLSKKEPNIGEYNWPLLTNALHEKDYETALNQLGRTYPRGGKEVPLINRVEALKKTYRNLINNPPQMATGKGVDKTRYGSLIG